MKRWAYRAGRLWKLLAWVALAPFVLGQGGADLNVESKLVPTEEISAGSLIDSAARDWLDEAHLLEMPEPDRVVVPSRLTSPPLATCKPFSPDEDWLASARKGTDGRYVVSRGASEQVLTLDPILHDKLQQILETYQTPYGAVVAIDPSSGRVLAMAEYSAQEPGLRGLARRVREVA